MNRRRRTLVWLILVLLLAVGLFMDLNAGYQKFTPDQIFQVLAGGGEASWRFSILELRLPRVLISMLVGIGLSAAGCLLQGVTRNDMAEAGILGINAGAGLAIALWIVFAAGAALSFSLVLPVLAFSGSLITALVEYRLAQNKGVLAPGRMLLVGIAIALGVTSASSMLMLRMSDSDYAFVQNWLAGNLWGADWNNVVLLSIGLAVLIVLALFCARVLNILLLGSDTATGLGVNVQRNSAWILLLSIGMSSLCCAVGGGFSFVGLICPHAARKLAGGQYQSLIITSALCGAVLMVWSDVISRSLFLPYEMPVGIVTAVLGAPYFLYLLTRRKQA